MLSEKKFKLSRLISLWLEVLLYSVVSYLLVVAINQDVAINLKDFVKSCLPVLSKRYWFFSSYVMLYLMTPFLNLFIKKANSTFLLLSVIVLMACFSLPTIVPKVKWMISSGNIGIFVTLYLTGALFKRITLSRQSKRYLLIATLFLFIVLITSEIVIKIFYAKYFTYFVWPMNRPTVVFIACLFFCTVKGIKFRLPKWAIICTQSTFGIYLIHIGALQDIIFSSVFSISPFFDKCYFLFVLILYALLVYVLCVCIERIRFNLLERHYQSVISKVSIKIENQIKLIVQRLASVLNLNY